MKRRVRLTEGQLRGIVEESSRRVIQEMIDEGWLGDTWNTMKSGYKDYFWNAPVNTLGGAIKAGWNGLTAVPNALIGGASSLMNGGNFFDGAKDSFQTDLNDARNGLKQTGKGMWQGFKAPFKMNPVIAGVYNAFRGKGTDKTQNSSGHPVGSPQWHQQMQQYADKGQLDPTMLQRIQQQRQQWQQQMNQVPGRMSGRK